MRKYLLILVASASLTWMYSCQKEFLQKPSTTGSVTVETVFSTADGARAAIAAAYNNTLSAGLHHMLGHGTLNQLAGTFSWGYNWHESYYIITNGLSATGPFDDEFNFNYTCIRQAYLIIENIDRVKDMDTKTKDNIRGEMLGLIAYRYMGMLVRYGGVPIVSHTLTSSDDLNIPRSSVRSTVDTIVSLCDRATTLLPDTWDDTWNGRLTRGVALAIKARTLMFAARPLFNTAQPYLSLGDNDSLICYGSADPQRWEDAIAANEAVIQWATSHGYHMINTGGAGAGQPDPNAFDDYATATSVPANKEVLLAFKDDEGNSELVKWYNMSNYYFYSDNAAGWELDNYGLSTNFLMNYYKSNGTDQTWPGLDEGNARPATEYFSKMLDMEPRFLADNMIHAMDPKNNPGDPGWSANNEVDRSVNQGGGAGKGAAVSVKYWYHAGSRTWFEYPLFRMPEFYLNLAEAYNETGNASKASENLNIVHNRAGLPPVTEADGNKLRRIIQREWAIEFYNENRRYFLLKHWREPNIGNGIIGGPRREFQFTTNGGFTGDPANLLTYYDQVTFQGFWAPKMFLEPIPQDEINKGILIQNPGY